MGKVAIVADGTCCLPADIISKYDIRLVPLYILYKGKNYKDGIDITPSEVYKIMRKREELPTTSTPSAGDFLEAFKQVSQKAESILCITLTSLQSKIYDVALVAQDMAKEEIPNIEIEVVDSRAVAGALGFVVLEAARAASEGCDLNKVANVARETIKKVSLFAMVDDLFYLQRTGRVGKAAAWVGSVLDVKPILEHNTVVGETAPAARPRTKNKAMKQLVDMVAEKVGNAAVHVNVHQADELEAGEKLKKEVSSRLNCSELYLTEFTPGMGVHAGPGILGIAFYTE